LDELLEFKSNKATYIARAGDDFLGGGQTAAVYRASVGDGQVFALKWLTDAVYEQRFFQEVDWLTELAHAPEAYGLKRNGQLLTPQVYDEQRQGERRFFVMDLASGQPLDEVLRRRGRLPEPAALAIAAQLTRVFTALHETLRRSYLDFQPRNVFWQEQSGQIMVIDWNLLSPKDRMDVATDLRSIGALLYRMLLGALPPTGGADARGRAAAHERWQEISLGARVLLQDLLEPRAGQRIEDARTARDRLEELRQRWEKAGDDLVREAAALFKQVKNGDATAMAQDATLLQVAVSLDLAGRQSGALALSNAMAMVRHNLEQEVANRRQDLTALARGISFFRSGDLDTAALLFEQALADAETPEDELQVRRWQAVLEARYEHAAGLDGADRQQIEALLDRFQEATRAYLDRSLSPQPDSVAWRKVKAEAEALHKDIAAVESLAVEASTWPVIQALQAGDWSEVPGETHNKKINSATQAKDAIANLPYADNLWTVLGVGDERASVTAVEDAISMLEDAVQAERNWRKLWLDARNARWDKIEDVRIRRLFEESEGDLSNIEPVFDLLSVVINKGQDALAVALFDGLVAKPSLTENDRRRVQAFESWLYRMQRLEEFVNVWGTRVSAPPTGHASTADAAPSIASDVNDIENGTTLSFPASWILSELKDISQEEPVAKNVSTRLIATAIRAVRICVREKAGVKQAQLLMNSIDKVVPTGQQNKELDQVRAELDCIDLDEDLKQTKRAIEEAELLLSELRDAISGEEQRKNEVDQRVEEHRQAEMQKIDQEAKKITLEQRILIDQELKIFEKKRKKQEELVNMVVAEKTRLLEQKDDLERTIKALKTEESELAEKERRLEQLQRENDALKSERANISSRITISQQSEIDRLKREAASWDGEKAQLVNRQKELEFRLRTLTGGSTASSGWRDLYEARIELETRLLHNVKTALDSIKKLEADAARTNDIPLLQEARNLLKMCQTSYDRNNRKWTQAGEFFVNGQFQQTARLYEEIWKDDFKGMYDASDLANRYAHSIDKDVVEVLIPSMYKHGREKDEANLRLMGHYSSFCQELAKQTKDQQVESIARTTRNTYESWRSALASSPGQQDRDHKTLHNR